MMYAFYCHNFFVRIVSKILAIYLKWEGGGVKIKEREISLKIEIFLTFFSYTYIYISTNKFYKLHYHKSMQLYQEKNQLLGVFVLLRILMMFF